ncbi:MAG: hypothetical protein GY851_24570, partial [bacterium]|nr:hypothetical protein [bacterium]
GGYIVAGETASFGLPQSHLYLVKTDGLGEEEWSRHFAELGTTRSDVAYCVQQTADLGFILAGRIHNPSTTTDCDVYLVKVTSGGTIEWTQALGGTGCDDGRYVQETSGGGYIVAGYTYSYGAGAADMYLIKTDASGNAQWSKTFGGTEEDKALCVQQTTDGGYILAGPTFSYGAVFENDMYLVKTDASGNELWSNTFGDTGSDTACSVRQTTDNGYILAGSTFSYGAGLDDMYVVKTLFNGNSGFPPSK